MNTSLRSNFICSAANTVRNGTIWFQDCNGISIIAYATSNLIAIVDAKSAKVCCTLCSHSSRITNVKLLTCQQDYVDIVSSGDDKCIKIWRHYTLKSLEEWMLVPVEGIDSMNAAVNSLQTCSGEFGCLVAASDASGLIKIWLRKDLKDFKTTFQLVEIIQMKSSIMTHQIHIDVLRNDANPSNSTVAVFLGSVDSKIYIRSTTVASLCSYCSNADSDCLFNSCGSLSGHEEWITSFSSISIGNGITLLASGSQDNKIRLWRIHTKCISSSSSSSSALTMNTVNVNVVDLANEVKDDEEEDDELTEKKDNHDVIDIETIEEITMSEARLTFFGHNCSHNIYLEALMIGHEDWVTHVQWLTDYTPLSTKSSHESAIPSDLRLFSTSMDRNMLIWKADESTGIWTPQVRIGDIGGLLGGCVGANLLGFVGGCVIPQNNAVLGIGYGGSFHLWCRLDETIYQHHTNRKEVILESWRPIPFLTGHFDMVKDLQWSFDGEFIMTTSSDQTCRLFAPMNYSLVIDFTSTNCLQKTTSDHEMKSWHEISRPQIHGYDLNSVQILSSDPYNDQYIIFTAGDEKIIRQFEASLCVIETLKSLCNIGNPSGESMKMSSKRVYRAYIPELGLSNKASDLMTSEEKNEQEARNVMQLDSTVAPLESQLTDYTIWPETKKLFGHHYDVVCLALSPCRRFLASSCKAKDSEHAKILLWDTATCVSVGTLSAHESTVVALQFSDDGRYLASAGKDRALCIYKAISLNDGNETPFSLYIGVKNAHKRIIWDCSWFPASHKLITASRDGSCKIWTVSDTEAFLPSDLSLLSCIYTWNPFNGQSVTACDIGPQLFTEQQISIRLLALGSETGQMKVMKLCDVGEFSPETVIDVPDIYVHGASVQRIKWSPNQPSKTANHFQFASCGQDHCVRIFSLHVNANDSII